MIDKLIIIHGDQPLNFLIFELLAVYMLVASLFLRAWPKKLGHLCQHSLSYNSGIEGIRGPLAFLIFFGHYLRTQNILLNNKYDIVIVEHQRLGSCGSFAVICFFALTGYLFWNKFLRNPDTDIIALIYGRLLRLVPAFLVVCVVSIPFIVFSDLGAFDGPILKVLRSVGSFFALGKYDEKFSQWVLLDIGPTWSLSYECLFYALLPFFFVVRRLTGGFLFHILFLALLGFWDPTHQFQFIEVGMIVAECALFLETYPYHRIIDIILGIIAPIIFVYSILRGESSYNGWYGLETALVVLALVRGSTFGGILSLPAFQMMGRVGYSTYLFHGLVIHLAIILTAPFLPFQTLNHKELMMFFIALMPALILISCLCFQFFELPFMNKRIIDIFCQKVYRNGEIKVV